MGVDFRNGEEIVHIRRGRKLVEGKGDGIRALQKRRLEDDGCDILMGICSWR